MKKPVVHITNLNLKYQHKSVLADLCWTINIGENWLLSGESGSGKTALAKSIANIIPNYGAVALNFDLESPVLPEVYYVANWYQFKDVEGQSNFYYQQRYNKQATETTNTVGAELRYFGKKNNLHFASPRPDIRWA
jgi:molybdate transport system ATP-binding protein